MTEEEWQACPNLEPILKFLEGSSGNQRLGRLFACACCGLLWDQLDPSLREGVVVAEQLADGVTTEARALALLALLERAHGSSYNGDAVLEALLCGEKRFT